MGFLSHVLQWITRKLHGFYFVDSDGNGQFPIDEEYERVNMDNTRLKEELRQSSSQKSSPLRTYSLCVSYTVKHEWLALASTQL